MIELAEVIGELRRELQEAINAGEGEQLRFELGPVELEATVAVEKGGGGGVKVRFWVLELGGDAKAGQVSTHRVKLALQAGRAAGARVAVTDALGLYGRKGNLLAAARARRRLERLAPA